MKKLFVSVSLMVTFTGIALANSAENSSPYITSKVNMVNRNLRSNSLGDGCLLCLIMSSAGFGAYLLRNAKVKSPVA